MKKATKTFLNGATSTLVGMGTGYIIKKATDDTLLALGGGCAACVASNAFLNAVIDKPSEPLPSSVNNVSLSQEDDEECEYDGCFDTFPIHINYADRCFKESRNSIAFRSVNALMNAIQNYNSHKDIDEWREVYYANYNMTSCMKVLKVSDEETIMFVKNMYQDIAANIIKSQNFTVDMTKISLWEAVYDEAVKLLDICDVHVDGPRQCVDTLRSIAAARDSLKRSFIKTGRCVRPIMVMITEYSLGVAESALLDLDSELDDEILRDKRKCHTRLEGLREYISDEAELTEAADVWEEIHGSVLKSNPYCREFYRKSIIKNATILEKSLENSEDINDFISACGESMDELIEDIRILEALNCAFNIPRQHWVGNELSWVEYGYEQTDILLVIEHARTVMAAAALLKAADENTHSCDADECESNTIEKDK